MNTPLHEEERNLPDTKNTHTDTQKQKWYHRFRTLPKSIIITILTSLIIIVSIIAYYEHQIGAKERYSYGYHHPRIYAYQIDPWGYFGGYDRMWYDHWQKFDEKMLEIERRHRAIFDMESRASDAHLTGRYTGSRIQNNDTLTYSLDVGSDRVSGTYNGTNTGLIYTIQKGLEGLGYRVEKQGDGYAFSGASQDNQKVLELFR